MGETSPIPPFSYSPIPPDRSRSSGGSVWLDRVEVVPHLPLVAGRNLFPVQRGFRRARPLRDHTVVGGAVLGRVRGPVVAAADALAPLVIRARDEDVVLLSQERLLAAGVPARADARVAHPTAAAARLPAA